MYYITKKGNYAAAPWISFTTNIYEIINFRINTHFMSPFTRRRTLLSVFCEWTLVFFSTKQTKYISFCTLLCIFIRNICFILVLSCFSFFFSIYIYNFIFFFSSFFSSNIASNEELVRISWHLFLRFFIVGVTFWRRKWFETKSIHMVFSTLFFILYYSCPCLLSSQ